MELNEEKNHSVDSGMIIDSDMGVKSNVVEPTIETEISEQNSASLNIELQPTNENGVGEKLQESAEITSSGNVTISSPNMELMEAEVDDKKSANLDNTNVSIATINEVESAEETGTDQEKANGYLNASLGIIAAAYCDSDTDDVEALDDECQVVMEKSPVANGQNTNYRNKDSSDEVDSEDDSSSSSCSSLSSSSTSSDESEDEDKEEVEGDGCKQGKNRQVRQHKECGEYDGLPPIEDLTISVPEVLCEPLGTVGWMVDQLVVITPRANTPTLNIDTVLFVDRGQRVLGRIFDVFGQVSEPHYCVRFNDVEHIKEKDIKVGMTVYFCPNTEYTSLVFMSELLKMKASDDVGEDEHPEFSDDEEEKAYFASLKQKQDRNTNGANANKSTNGEVPNKRCRMGPKTGWRSQHPWNSNRRNQYHNNSTPRGPNESFQYQQPPWRPPMNYSQFGWPPQAPQQNWPRPFGHQPRPHFYSQPFHGISTPAQQPFMNYGWQQQTHHTNLWNTPPPPPPPNV